MDSPLNPSPLPEDFSQLNYIYPGRPIHNTQASDRSNVPPENPVETNLVFEESKEQINDYANVLENTVRKQGGGDKQKLPFTPAVAPDMQTEDPNMLYSTLQQTPMNEGVSPPTKEEIKPHILIDDEDVSFQKKENIEKFTSTKKKRREDDEDQNSDRRAMIFLIIFIIIIVCIYIIKKEYLSSLIPVIY